MTSTQAVQTNHVAPTRSIDNPTSVPSRRLVTMLALRITAFALFQVVVAIVLAGLGDDRPWASSAAWWPLTATAANLLNLALLGRWARAERFSLMSFYRPRRGRIWRDVLTASVVAIVGGALAVGGNTALAMALWGDAQTPLDLLIGPLPVWAAVPAVVLFPVTTAAVELPHYYGYVQPRLARLRDKAWLVVAVPAIAHAVQHVTLPLVFDARFMLWRALMFAPFALLVAWALRRRPSLLPYLVVVHFIIDLQTALMLVGAVPR